MKLRALVTATALISTSFTPISLMTSQAAATPIAQADPGAPTMADMQAYCDNTYVATHSDPTVWKAEVTSATATPTAVLPVPGTETQVNYRPDFNSTFSYANFLRVDDPLTRTGGSVNMWGQSVFGAKIYDNTLYDVQMRFAHDVTYTWTCHVSEYVTTVTHVGGNDGGGSGNNGQNNGLNEQDGGNGNGNNGCGNGNSGPNGTNDNCGGHDVTHSEWVFRADYATGTQTDTGIDDGTDITATNQQLAGQVAGVDYTVLGEFKPAGVRTLACINPGKKGGTWTAKNGYTGANCTTTYFNTAVTAYGTTFDTITGTLPSASLPQ